eukprot:CAMPEP_0177670096 /NCGR_PEP_ID=MMETSP0447-20121125/23879_1 /TAXON_ID=0 /ORGANISM="Stygamoeba regulata, Strain BSH-02190019" /LENGTH=96 /DNA_ID=CAMNT_0019177181 /DNA_START=44 /DNA_END=334 /DNA_ORIENTATION=-
MASSFEVIKTSPNAGDCGWDELRSVLAESARTPEKTAEIAALLAGSPLVRYYVVVDRNAGLSFSLPPHSAWAKIRYHLPTAPNQRSFTIFWTLDRD